MALANAQAHVLVPGRLMSEKPRKLLLSRQEAAALLGMSLRHFERYVQPHIPCAYIGQLRQYRPRDLERWVDQNVTERKVA
jgi:hypothetical protein